VTAEWCSTTIDAACNIEYGTRVVQKRDGGSVFPVYGGGGATFFMDTANRESRVVVSRFGMSEECTRFVDGRFFLNDSGLTLSPKDVESLLPTFLDRLILSLNREIFSLGRGAAQKNLDVPAFKALRISYPSSIADQRRIVAILDEAFEGIATAKAHAERNLRNAREVFASRLRYAFSAAKDNWVQVRLGDACSIARGGSPRPIKEFLTSEPDGVNWVKISDATASAKYIFATAEKIRPTGVSRSRLVHDGDFLLSNSMSFGRPYIMRTTGCIHDGWLVLSNYQGTFSQDFLYLLLGSSFVYQQFDRLAAGSTVRNLNIDLASSVLLPAPPLDEQIAIAEELDELGRSIDQLGDVYRRKRAALEELKQSLLHQAFSGQL
jgi:type I restriction enzyme S subunit